MLFRSVPSETSVDLFWKERKENPDYSVVLVRSETGFPESPIEGEVLFMGEGNTFTDREVTQNVTYFYSIFTRYSDATLSNPTRLSARIKDSINPGVPSNFSQTLTESGVKMTWQLPADPDLKHVVISKLNAEKLQSQTPEVIFIEIGRAHV